MAQASSHPPAAAAAEPRAALRFAPRGVASHGVAQAGRFALEFSRGNSLECGESRQFHGKHLETWVVDANSWLNHVHQLVVYQANQAAWICSLTPRLFFLLGYMLRMAGNWHPHVPDSQQAARTSGMLQSPPAMAHWLSL